MTPTMVQTLCLHLEPASGAPQPAKPAQQHFPQPQGTRSVLPFSALPSIFKKLASMMQASLLEALDAAAPSLKEGPPLRRFSTDDMLA